MNTTDDVTAYSAEQAKQSILALVAYALQKEIIEKQDTVWAVNTLWALLGEPGYTWSENELEALLQQEQLTPPLLEQLFSQFQVVATHNGVTIPANEDGTALSSYIMGALMPRPSWVAQHFWQLMHADSSPDIASKQATDWFYKLSCDCDYVRLNAIRRDVKWTV
ncbi:MAG: hypothetical protein IKE43_07005, partial [Coriobacteriales bacterium]|nr:hypothetical protein [Coriobacteriales bacterium]